MSSGGPNTAFILRHNRLFFLLTRPHRWIFPVTTDNTWTDNHLYCCCLVNWTERIKMHLLLRREKKNKQRCSSSRGSCQIKNQQQSTVSPLKRSAHLIVWIFLIIQEETEHFAKHIFGAWERTLTSPAFYYTIKMFQCSLNSLASLFNDAVT